MALVASNVAASGQIIPKAMQKDGVVAIPSAFRKSGLAAPTMLLSGHEGEVFSTEFSSDGRNILTASADKQIFIYQVYGDCPNWCAMRGHTNAVLEAHWSPDNTHIYSCSADKTCAVFDVNEGKRIKKLSGHTAVVNSCHVTRRGPGLLVSGADDGTTKVWDLRARRCVKTFEHQYQILAVSFDDNGERIFAGSLDHTVKIYNMRKGEEEALLQGHMDSITGLDVSKDGTRLLTNSMDQTVRMWDIQPFFAGADRCVGVFTGATHNFEKNLLRVRWSPQDRFFSAGSADRYVYIWNAMDLKLVYKLPGHAGSVNEVAFHPQEPVVASASSDRKVFMGELGD